MLLRKSVRSQLHSRKCAKRTLG